MIVGSRVGPWQEQELTAFLRQLVKRRCAVVPVLLPGADHRDLSVFLDGLTWVDLSATEPDPIDQLVWGITGEQPKSRFTMRNELTTLCNIPDSRSRVN